MEIRVQRLFRILVAVAAILALVFAAGYLLPVAWHAERSVLIRAPAPTVFAYLNNLKNWREWTVWYQQHPDMPTEYSGPDAGVGATSRWRDENGRGVMKIMRTDADQRIDYQILFDAGATRVNGMLMLVPEGEGTRVVWGATGATGRHPVARYFALVLGYRIGSDFEASLLRLKQKLDPKS